jgi:hypothetical protein
LSQYQDAVKENMDISDNLKKASLYGKIFYRILYYNMSLLFAFILQLQIKNSKEAVETNRNVFKQVKLVYSHCSL